MKILFLYTELADYTIACLEYLKKKSQEELEFRVVHYPVNPEAPFRFEFDPAIFHSIEEIGSYEELRSFVSRFAPDKIVCSGWSNRLYVRVCRAYSNKTCCMLTMDNHWTGSWKQRIFSFIFPVTLGKIFRKIWIPGDAQWPYARKLGFRDDQIIRGFYSCDVGRFNAVFQKYREQKKKNFPRRLLCVARYIPSKGYETLWNAFIQWKQRYPNDWQLWCAGTGQDFDKRVHHKDIIHLGFVQKDQWDAIIEQTGVFVLPSLFEPWGVVVHEFATAGYPLLLSSRVGAASAFLSTKNGWQFEPGNEEELISLFQQVAGTGEEGLTAMAEHSNRLAQSITPSTWARTLLQA